MGQLRASTRWGTLRCAVSSVFRPIISPKAQICYKTRQKETKQPPWLQTSVAKQRCLTGNSSLIPVFVYDRNQMNVVELNKTNY
ncbi:hypothetical protein H5410_009426 [Solanum commersonii]|uniref:Uncharacterized protein n=1 Tax=Solanum commersonii TaxID=4109 RepID=A0A9J6AHZ7_SOLCO|nr:hypothetical protein H5410_009426 [Solanum commersonii]